jgi:hypothetical protein
LAKFETRIPDAEEFARLRRILLLRAANGTDIDISLGALPFEAAMIARARPLEFAPGIRLQCCSAEDLFIMKMFAARTRDLLDAQGIAVRQIKLDTSYILRHLGDLCALKETPELVDHARKILKGKP